MKRIDSISTTTTHGRKVDGRKLRSLLATETRYSEPIYQGLIYTSWRTGIPASIQEENSEGSPAVY
jgi:hypothetical protein